jgi:cysteine desulfurase
MFWNKKKRVFLDYASTTPIAPEVLDVMEKYDRSAFANPSALYTEALAAKDLVQESRSKVAEILHCQKSEVILTSGGTEGNNLALLGIFEATKKDGFFPHFITTTIEHPSVLEVFEEIKKRGGEVTLLSVNEEGFVSSKDVREAIKQNTVLVSVMYANNEIGTIQPIKEIGRVIKDWRQKNNSQFPYFHTDACQTSLYLSLDVLKLGVDLMTLDGIKMYGPRGTGILFMKSDIQIKPIVFGGGQERGLRSGTEDVSAIIGFAKALEIANKKQESESLRLTTIRDFAIDTILKTFPMARLNGSKENRLPNNINICFPGIDAEFSVISLDVAGIACSYSSSCRTLKDDSSSYVIESLGKKECKESSLRFTLGRATTLSDITFLISTLKNIIK